jgi:hypothetical protein
MRFPKIEARSLDGRLYRLPDDLPAGPRIVVVAFQRWQTSMMAAWLPYLEGLRRERPLLSVWQLPVLSRVYAPARRYIDGGMRLGTEGIEEHSTLTVYTDVRLFASDLSLPSLDTIYVLLVDTTGEVVWSGSGYADVDQLRELTGLVDAQLGSSDTSHT